MRPCLISNNDSRSVLRLVVVLILLASHLGCANELKPGVVCDVAIIAKGDDGKPAVQGEVKRVDGAVTNNVVQLTQDGRNIALLVRKTEYGKATFDIKFPDDTIQRVKVENGKAKDVLPDGQPIGMRIEVHECR
jgi:hypothetical protein